jgi:hypothetical protein
MVRTFDRFWMRFGKVKFGLTFIPKSTAQRFTKVFGNSINADTTHGSHCKSANQRIGIAGVLYKSVHGQKRQLWLGFGIINKIQIDELLQFNVSSLKVWRNK